MAWFHSIQLTPKRYRRFVNFFPPYLFSRTKIMHVADDWQETVVKIKRSFLNTNYVGTMFGGTMSAASDPHYMLMLLQILGMKTYLIWDKSGEINFKKPVTSDLTFHFKITDDDLKKIKEEIKQNGVSRPEFVAQGLDQDGKVCVEVKRVVSIRPK